MTEFPVIHTFNEAYEMSIIQGMHKPKHLLLGNGFSIALNNSGMKYTTLFDSIKDLKELDRIKEIFKYLGTSNFEEVLKLLNHSKFISKTYDKNADLINSDYDLLKKSLAKALTKVHLHDSSEVSPVKKISCNRFLTKFEKVFTVNYDLLLYWTVLSEEDGSNFGDLFSRDGSTPLEYCEFFPSSKTKKNCIYFLHGALHLFQENGVVFKKTFSNTGIPLIDQIKKSIDQNKYPLVIAEGDSEEKVKGIKEIGYLNHVFYKLSDIGGSVFTFGFSFSEQDKHIYHKLAENKNIRRIFIGIRGNFYKKSNKDIFRITNKMKELRIKKLKTNPPGNRNQSEGFLDVLFYNSDSASVWK